MVAPAAVAAAVVATGVAPTAVTPAVALAAVMALAAAAVTLGAGGGGVELATVVAFLVGAVFPVAFCRGYSLVWLWTQRTITSLTSCQSHETKTRERKTAAYPK